ncbi:hypothetical protein P8A21_29935 [Streptomyces poriferorum]|uniref:hypothetical protein n=1 Tax=Streptomyces TaxID=1883 RepID=UPI001C5E854A|nr:MULTISPECIES: hypothetical protein [Streptomyces]MBW5249010.1 hypothetical protein [Streptomyces poriferorum]MBW5257077.1 hypothetical protein [Streptomyces poriferorum]WLQ51444.1 hypothetical protein P8A21_29935 [Streptomyces sp. Alt1]WSI66288.1 hypothetical protein OG471_31515 [Streptomyces sp. NBC_01336]
MPLIPEEPQIHESVQGPRATTATGRTASTPRPVPGPRSAAMPRPGRPGPGPARPAPPAPRPHSTSGQPQAARPENRSAPQLQVVPAAADGALDAADEAVDLLLDSGRAPGDILVLTTGEQHPWATHELSFGEAAYWAQHEAGEDVFFAGAAAVDRLKPRPVVIIAVNGAADDTAERALTTAQGRAGALLIVCGDPQRINAVLGAGV